MPAEQRSALDAEDALPDELPPELAARLQKRGGTATIYDIAELAGVNPSTVSRALSKPGRISAKTEKRIRAAAERLEFRFNPMARALPTGRTHTLALVVADITNPMFFGIVRGAEQAASAAGYTLIITESQESGANEAEAISRVLPSVDGLVLATTRLDDERISEIAARKPLVAINRDIGGVASVLPEIEAGVTDLLEHLVGHGHRTVSYLSGPENSWISRRRWEILLDVAERLDVGLVEIGPNPPTIEGGRAAWRRVIAARPTAVIAFNDLMAIGVIQSAAAAGVSVPGSLSVAGFDDIFGSELIVPALTTVRAQLVLAGQLAVEKLLGQIDDDADVAVDEPLATKLIVRESTAEARSGPWSTG
ncbi:LacI family transcriptional regulator [Pseudoclavibacter sp. JAI123]|uniref:LacI family DNA-binding transcriptional regulator n=1 Tax=Pseudoclavibacter sp. JAI123 TaxID=2723065 RepID=UPI0015C77D3C|nr:LacI family DNA-binding transcriptional regulator [Pseudoclavibacter sp. JAI123]NYF12262.1 LacI family transcriptional regulator [Pseudoclavibacter sp. JAI123]